MSFTQIPNEVLRTGTNLKLAEIGMLAYLSSHTKEHKTTITSISRLFNTDIRTIKSILGSLASKGYKQFIQEVLITKEDSNVN